MRGRLTTSVVIIFVHTDRSSECLQYYDAGTHALAYPTDSTHGLLRYVLDALEGAYKEESRRALVYIDWAGAFAAASYPVG